MAVSAQQSGEQIYQDQCASCHGADGAGSGSFPALNGDAPMTTYSDFDSLVTKIDDTMPASNPDSVSGSDAEAVATYLVDSLGNPASDGGGAQPTATPMPGDADRGRALFTGEASLENGGPSCISCHDVQGVGQLGGGSLARDLTNVYDRFGAGLNAWLQTTPVPLMQDVYGGDNQLSSQDRADLVAFFEQVNDRQPADGTNTAMFAGAGVVGFIVIAVIFAILWRNRFTKRNGGNVHDDLWRNYGGKK